MNKNVFPQPFQVVTTFYCSICPLVPIVTRLIVALEKELYQLIHQEQLLH